MWIWSRFVSDFEVKGENLRDLGKLHLHPLGSFIIQCQTQNAWTNTISCKKSCRAICWFRHGAFPHPLHRHSFSRRLHFYLSLPSIIHTTEKFMEPAGACFCFCFVFSPSSCFHCNETNFYSILDSWTLEAIFARHMTRPMTTISVNLQLIPGVMRMRKQNILTSSSTFNAELFISTTVCCFLSSIFGVWFQDESIFPSVFDFKQGLPVHLSLAASPCSQVAADDDAIPARIFENCS